MSIKAGHAYRIRNKNSNLYLNVKYYSTRPSEKIEQWPLQKVGDDNRASQIWHLFPIDNNAYLIANLKSGLVLNVYRNSCAQKGDIEQYILQDIPGATQTWSPKPETISGDCYYIIENVTSHLYLTVSDRSKENSHRIEQHSLDKPNRDHQVWALEEEISFLYLGTPIDQVALGVTGGDANDIGDVIRMTSLLPPTPSSTKEVLVGRAVIPFPFIDDPTLGVQQQSKDSPYYVLNRYGYWEMVYYYQHSGMSKVVQTKSVFVGMASSNSKEVEKTTGISVSAEASFEIFGFRAAISTTFSQTLNVKTSSTVTKESSRTVTVERNYDTGKELAEAIWYRYDRYELQRLDGSKVLEWKTCDESRVVDDGFTEDVPSK